MVWQHAYNTQTRAVTIQDIQQCIKYAVTLSASPKRRIKDGTLRRGSRSLQDQEEFEGQGDTWTSRCFPNGTAESSCPLFIQTLVSILLLPKRRLKVHVQFFQSENRNVWISQSMSEKIRYLYQRPYISWCVSLKKISVFWDLLLP